MKGKYKRHIAVGDIHGELDGLKEILKHSTVIDDNGNWSGHDVVLVQTGDVIDRGPHSIESVSFLRNLQDQAFNTNKGEVVRLCGNHELVLLQGNDYFVNFKNGDELANELKEEVKSGQLTAAYTDGRRLFTHAGLRSQLRIELMKAISPDKAYWEVKDIDLHLLTEHINKIFRNFVMTHNQSHHPIFSVDEIRGGTDPFGGIFWGDYSLIESSAGAWEIPQVFGHTPSRKNKVQHCWNLSLINIDAGMYKIYGGHRVYLEIDTEGNIIEHSKNISGSWKESVLSQLTI